MNLSFQIFKPEFKGTVADQAESCIDQLEEYLVFNQEQIVTITAFVKADKYVYLEQKQVIFEHLIEEKFNRNMPISFIAQPPTEDYEYVIEVHTFKNLSNQYTLRYKDDDNFSYTVIESNQAEKFLFVSGIYEYYKNGNVSNSSNEAFKRMLSILKYENMDMSHIFRQWNYIEGIIETKDEHGLLSQNYQDFNDIRSKWFNKCEFTNGYPAATGIGTKTGGINISFYAYKGNSEKTFKSVVNPLQVEAFDYSAEVLVGDIKNEKYCKTSPKFDRAKYIPISNKEMVYISGTAAIRGEETLGIANATEQTDITILNMLELLKPSSFNQSKITTQTTGFQLLYIRIYVKNKADVQAIEKVCNHYFPHIPKAFVIADVCRDELLVEIEGVAKALK